MEYKLAHRLTLTTIECCNCGITFAMPESRDNIFRNDGGTFYCPIGHGQSYSKSEVDRLREKLAEQTRQASALAQRAHDNMIAKLAAEKSEHKAQLEIKRIKRRAAAGVCPCCNRTFVQLQRHMKTKHPDHSS